MKPKPRLQLHPERRLVMTFALRQALEILQMPQQELGLWLQSEIEQNPLLEWDGRSSNLPLGEIASPTTLHDLLTQQIDDRFSHPKDRRVAYRLLESLDERGFLSEPLDAIASELALPTPLVESILSAMQIFEPPGIFSRNLRESLLLQLAAQNQQHSQASALIRDSFDDLLQRRFSRIKKKIGASNLTDALFLLSRLSLRPADRYRKDPVSIALPDLYLLPNEEKWNIELNESELPQFHIRSDYFSLTSSSPEEQESLRAFKTSAKWLVRSLSRRRKLLTQIGLLLVQKQSRYLDQKGPLVPLTAKELADELQIHESTFSRAIAGKFASTPRGLIPLRELLSSSPETDAARRTLAALVRNEDKRNPLTDDQLAEALQASGCKIARRTISKYRKQLQIGPASQRKFLSH